MSYTLMRGAAFGTISQYANQVAHERLFLCLKFRIRKVFLALPISLSQPDSIYINLLMWVNLRVSWSTSFEMMGTDVVFTTGSYANKTMLF